MAYKQDRSGSTRGLIERSAWKENSANFALSEFSEVRQERCNKYCN